MPRDLTPEQARAMRAAGGGRKKGQVSAATLDAMILRDILIKEASKHGIEIAQALVKQAKTGNVPAIKELYDRTVGKSVENHNITGSIEIKIDI